MLASKCVQVTSRVPGVWVQRATYATATATSKPKSNPLSKPLAPPKSPAIKTDKPKDFPPFPDTDIIGEPPVPAPPSLSVKLPPIASTPQPFKKPAVSAGNKVPSPPSTASTPFSLSTPSSSPASSATPSNFSIPEPVATPGASTNISIPHPNPKPAAKKKDPSAPAAPKGSKAKAPALTIPSAASQKRDLARDLAGRSPAQLLTQVTQLQQHNATLQSQLVYHSAVEAIYGESGFNQLRNMLSEINEEETSVLKASGFESEHIIHNLEARQRELCLQYTQAACADLSKHITAYVKKLKDQHRQSASAATATQQTLRNAGVPDSVISSTLVGLQPHLDELQSRIARWEKLKADVDLLLATHSSNH